MHEKTREFLDRIAGDLRADVLDPAVAAPVVTKAVRGAQMAAAEAAALRALWGEVSAVEEDTALVGQLEELNQRLGGLYREADRLAEQARKVGKILRDLQDTGARKIEEHADA